MSQKMPKLPQLDMAVHGFGYLEKNYGKNYFGFSEIPPKVGICDSFVMHFGFYFGFLFRKLFVIHFRWYSDFLLYVHKHFLMYLWCTSENPKCRKCCTICTITIIIIVVNLRLNCLPGVLSWDLGLSNIFGCCLVNSCGGLRKGEPVQSWVHF